CEAVLSDIDSLSAMLLDREMPEMNGLEVVAWLKENNYFRRLPIVMQTGADTPEQIKEGIDAGVFYYLTKPVDDSVLSSVLTSAVCESDQQSTLRQEMNMHRASFALVDECKGSFRTLAEAESFSCFVANFFPDPDRVLSGLAELLINAVEHGNLAISYEEKSELIANGTWRKEIARRLELPEYKDRQVKFFFTRGDDGPLVTIDDEGVGFDWSRYMEIDPARAMDNHGRGIAQANMLSFDSLEFNDVGNSVTARVTVEPELDW
ncbi:MAG: response regulator, partial [Gammaproteobacteria bacterium]|nr:response regulator [Gammaproteobacteria bacterium]